MKIEIEREDLKFLISYLKGDLIHSRFKKPIEQRLREILDVLELDLDTSELEVKK